MDRIDDAILGALQNDGRMSNKELAAQVGLAPSSCLDRVRRLHERGVIRGYHAEVDPGAMKIGLQAFVFVRLTQHRGAMNEGTPFSAKKILQTRICEQQLGTLL